MKKDKTQIAYEIIKDKILEGALAPLCDISEEKLQNELSISRTPIREAIQRLKKEGFVHIYPRKGTIVSDISMELIFSIYEVRLLNEPYLARQACEKIENEWLLEMDNAFKNPPRDLSEQERRRYFIDLDRKLHSHILDCSTNIFLKEIIQAVYSHNHRIRVRTSKLNENYGRSVEEHIAIIDALLERNGEKIETTVRSHIKESQNDALKYFQISI